MHEENEDHYHRIVCVPMEKMEQCDVCSSAEGLRLCAACGERLYCSRQCQVKDWGSHKPYCGKTDRIDIGSYYPLLAIIQDQCHQHKIMTVHPAMERQVLNDVNPGTSHPFLLPDGYESKVVMMGGKKPMQELHATPKDWWPLAQSDNVASKLQRRICRGGNLLPINLAVCIGLLAEMYTTDYGPGVKSHRHQHPNRVRLKYKSSPITDFGIASGWADVKPQDRLAFWDVEGDLITIDQDPNNHYWIYFTTLRDETLYLDCGMFTFDLCNVIGTEPYVPPHVSHLFPWAPAFFRDTVMRHNAPPVEHERRRFSVLRNANMHEAVMHSTRGYDDDDCKIFFDFMEKISGKKPTKQEEEMLGTFAIHAGVQINMNIQSGGWKTFPAEPNIGIEVNPGQFDDYDNQVEAWDKHLKEWKKRLREERRESRGTKKKL